LVWTLKQWKGKPQPNPKNRSVKAEPIKKEGFSNWEDLKWEVSLPVVPSLAHVSFPPSEKNRGFEWKKS